MGKLTGFITPLDWLQLKRFLLSLAFDRLRNDIKIFNITCSHRKLLKKKRLPSQREPTTVTVNATQYNE